MKTRFYSGLMLASLAVVMMLFIAYSELSEKPSADVVQTSCRTCAKFCYESGYLSDKKCRSCCYCKYSNTESTIHVYSAGDEMLLKKSNVAQGLAVCENIEPVKEEQSRLSGECQPIVCKGFGKGKYHNYVSQILPFLDEKLSTRAHPLSIVVVGLGLAALQNVILSQYDVDSLTTVELDDLMIQVFEKHFSVPKHGFASADGFLYVQDLAKENVKLDALIVDLDHYSHVFQGITRNFTEALLAVISPSGFAMINTVGCNIQRKLKETIDEFRIGVRVQIIDVDNHCPQWIYLEAD